VIQKFIGQFSLLTKPEKAKNKNHCGREAAGWFISFLFRSTLSGGTANFFFPFAVSKDPACYVSNAWGHTR
jgi:hypothetical protein